MEYDTDDLQLGSITLRASMPLLKELKSKYGRGKKYRDRSEAIRSLLQLGLRMEGMLEIYNDPEKKKEFEEKLSNLFLDNNYRKTLETMSDKDLSAIMFICQDLKDKKIEQVVLDVKKS